MDNPTPSKNRQIIAALAVLIVVVAIVAAASVSSKKKTVATSMADTASTSTSSTTPATTSTTSTSTSSTYKDGTYTESGSYDSPGGTEKITVTVTLKSGVITSTSAVSGAGDSEAQEYQDMFISGYKSLVVGKDINKVSLSRVSGSSLTSQGFNDAIKAIEKDATA